VGAELLVGLGDGGAAMLLDEGEDAGQDDDEEQRNLEPETKRTSKCYQIWHNFAIGRFLNGIGRIFS